MAEDKKTVNWHSLEKEEVLKQLESSPEGLTPAEAKKRCCF
ncbi:MAG: cation-transporting P-type ATPase [Candidatus Omnitrophota bacterium]|nr:cation-transporting P-type ATPase [Candidatus Omnitrophota bacterium]